MIWQLTTTKNLEVIYGIDLKAFEALVPFHYLQAALSRVPTIALWMTILLSRSM